MATSSLELPLWILTATADSGDYPVKPFFPLAYACHLVALPGYFACIGIVVVLWRDLLESTRFRATYIEKQGRCCKDRVRSFLFFFTALYFTVEFAVAISVLAKMDWRRPYDFFDDDVTYQASILFDPAMLLIFTSGFIYYGFKIQCHVRRVKLNQNVHMRVLCQLNFFVSVITICYLLRAFIVTGLFFQGRYMEPYHHSDEVYFKWDDTMPFIQYVMVTQWFPFILTSYCLLYLMRKPPSTPTADQPQLPQVASPCQDAGAEEVYFGFEDSNVSVFSDSHGSSWHGGSSASYPSMFEISGKSNASTASYSSSVDSSDVFGVQDLDEKLIPDGY
jgi:hypothetical protein